HESQGLRIGAGTKKRRPIMVNKFSNEYVRHIFSTEEKRAIAEDLARKVAELKQKEDDKKAIISEMKSKIDGLTAMLNVAAVKLNNGYEMITVKCEFTPDWPGKLWLIHRTDNGEFVKERKMSPDDLQMRIKWEASGDDDKIPENFTPAETTEQRGA
ncbi:hypothetical protein LCGC14_2621260, partial [marine sediment metagenome]